MSDLCENRLFLCLFVLDYVSLACQLWFVMLVICHLSSVMCHSSSLITLSVVNLSFVCRPFGLGLPSSIICLRSCSQSCDFRHLSSFLRHLSFVIRLLSLLTVICHPSSAVLSRVESVAVCCQCRVGVKMRRCVSSCPMLWFPVVLCCGLPSEVLRLFTV